MSGREIQVGDFVDISLGSSTGTFIISEISPNEIVIHPKGQPEIRNGIVSTPSGWKVKGAENEPYQLNFYPRSPPRSSRSPPRSSRSSRSPDRSPARSPARSSRSPPRSSRSPPRSPRSPARSPRQKMYWGPTPPTTIDAPSSRGRTLSGLSPPVDMGRTLSGTIKPEVPTVNPIPEELYRLGQICSSLVKRDPVSESEQDELFQYARENELPLPNTPVNVRRVCDIVLSKAIETSDPNVNVSRLNTQNLARRFDSISSELELELERIRQREEEELRRFEEEEAERLEAERQVKQKFEQIRAIEQAKPEAYIEEDKKIKGQFEDRCVGPSKLPITPFKFTPDDNLTGRRVEIPKFYWERLFLDGSRPLTTSTISQSDIDAMVIGLLGEIPPGLSEAQKRDMLGLQSGGVQLNDDFEQSQIYLRIEGLRHPVYVLISGFHDGQKDLFKVSSQVYHELGGKPLYLDAQDCGLNQVSFIGLNLLWDPVRPEADEGTVKNQIIDVIADYGVLIVGDILPVKTDNGTLFYRIESLVSEDGIPMYAASLPEVSQEVNMSIDFESRDELADKLEPFIPNLDRSLV